MFYKDERLALLIDGANLFGATKVPGFDIDYKLLRQEFMRRGRLLRAFYYTALLENEEYSPIRPLADWLAYNGFNADIGITPTTAAAWTTHKPPRLATRSVPAPYPRTRFS